MQQVRRTIASPKQCLHCLFLTESGFTEMCLQTPSPRDSLQGHRAAKIRRRSQKVQNNFKRLVGLVDKGRLEELNMYSLAEPTQWGITVGGGGGWAAI